MGLAGMDFFVVPTVRFQLLYVWFVLDHNRRRILHFNVTSSPTAAWVIQQLREAFPHDSAPDYLIYDNGSMFSGTVAKAIQQFGICPKRTTYRSPWQNGIAERWVGSVLREFLNPVIVMNEVHLRRLLRCYVDYYNAERVHTRLRDAPEGRRVEPRPSPNATVVSRRRVGGLHHCYEWKQAA